MAELALHPSHLSAVLKRNPREGVSEAVEVALHPRSPTRGMPARFMAGYRIPRVTIELLR
jgi:hypothetical protein